jgi:hypothetical protein
VAKFSKRWPASGKFHTPQLVASNFVLFERGLIGGVRRALGRDHTGSRTASYTFGADESGYLGIAIVVRHDLSFRSYSPSACELRDHPFNQAVRHRTVPAGVKKTSLQCDRETFFAINKSKNSVRPRPPAAFK